MTTTANRLLLIEDDRSLAADLSSALERLGWRVTGAVDIAAAKTAFGRESFDLVLLDLGLPDGHGLELLGTFRRAGFDPPPPLIIVSAQDALDARVAALSAGADDYLVKPFSVAELDARVRAVLRRVGQGGSGRLLVENLAIEARSGIVTVDGKAAGFTPREASLIELLARNTGHVVGRSAVAETVFASGDTSDTAIEVLVHRLRRRLSESRARVVLHTIRGIGYLLARAP